MTEKNSSPPNIAVAGAGGTCAKYELPEGIWYVNWVSLGLTAIIAAISHWGIGDVSNRWPVTNTTMALYDFPMNEDTVPVWGVGVFGLAMTLFIIIYEFVFNKEDNKRIKYYFLANVVLGLWEAFFMTVLLTEFGKIHVGEARPDFVARCTGGAPPMYNSAGRIICTGDVKEIEEGLKSFPSGHSSTSAVIGLYTTLYFLWSAYSRDWPCSWRCPNKKGWSSNVQRMIQQAMMIIYVIPVATGWAIAATRVADFRHSPADVTAGAVVGLFIAGLYIYRLLGDWDVLSTRFHHMGEKYPSSSPNTIVLEA